MSPRPEFPFISAFRILCPWAASAILFALVLIALLSTAHAQPSLRDVVSGRAYNLPNRFSVTKDEIEALGDGAKEVSKLPWARLDLVTLAKTYPQIEDARQKAMLTGEATYFTVTPPPNYMAMFLSLEISATFDPAYRVTARTATAYQVSVAGSISNVAPGVDSFQASGFVRSNSVTQTRIESVGPSELSGTIETVLMRLSEENIEVTRTIKALHRQTSFFANLRAGFANLRKIYPQDKVLADTEKAVIKLSSEVNVDAQRKLAEFIRYARQKS